MKKIRLAAVVLAGTMLAGAGCDLETAADPNLSASPASPGAAGGKVKDDLHKVTYKVSGSANRAMMTYTTPSGVEQATKPLPWQKSLKAEPGTFVSVSAQNEGASGKVTCVIVVDGETVKRASSSGAYAVVSCDATLGW